MRKGEFFLVGLLKMHKFFTGFDCSFLLFIYEIAFTWSIFGFFASVILVFAKQSCIKGVDSGSYHPPCSDSTDFLVRRKRRITHLLVQIRSAVHGHRKKFGNFSKISILSFGGWLACLYILWKYVPCLPLFEMINFLVQRYCCSQKFWVII